MYDNGLLKFYASQKSEKGFLDVSKLGVTKVLKHKRGATKKIIDGQPFYVKNVIKNKYGACQRHNLDAEILLSQIYAKAGLQTAIYLPATSGDNQFLVSNDVSTPQTLSAITHLYPLFGVEIGSKTYLRPLLFLSQDQSKLEVDPKLILPSSTMGQQTLMRILDVASFNDDRHSQNFFYNIATQTQNLSRQQEDFFGDEQGGILQPLDAIFNLYSKEEIMEYYRTYRAEGVVSIDYGASGDVLLEHITGSGQAEQETTYANDFTYDDLTASDFKKQIVTNPNLPLLVDKNELAETIGSLDPQAVAEDVFSTIGYKIDTRIVDTLSTSYDDMAETLLK